MGKTIQKKSRWVAAEGPRRVREWPLMDTRFLWGVLKCVEIRLWWWLQNSKYSKIFRTVCFKGGNFLVCEICLNRCVYEKKSQKPEVWREGEGFMKKMTFDLWMKGWGVVFCIKLKVFSAKGKSKGWWTTADPWTTLVWSAWVHLCPDFPWRTVKNHKCNFFSLWFS